MLARRWGLRDRPQGEKRNAGGDGDRESACRAHQDKPFDASE
jgi:hypothetical protein